MPLKLDKAAAIALARVIRRVAPEDYGADPIEEFAAMIGCTVEDVIAGEMSAREARNDANDGYDGYDDEETVWNPPAGASWVDDRSTPLRRVSS